MKNIKRLCFTLLFILIVLTLSACGDGEASRNNSENSEESPESITISGSSAIQPLVATATEKYMEEFDGDIVVNAGRSGLSEVSEGTVNIGNSDVFAEAKDKIFNPATCQFGLTNIHANWFENFFRLYDERRNTKYTAC